MKITKFVTLATTAMATAVFGLTAAQAELNKDKVYVVGTEATYAPYEYLNQKGEVEGFDIDLINYICKEIGIQCKISNQSFDGLIPNLKFKKIDLAIAGFHPTEARAKAVDFSEEYLPKETVTYVVLKTAPFKEVTELKTVGSQAGTSQSQYLEKKTNYKVVKYATNDLAYLDLEAKRLDAYILGSEVAKQTLAQFPNFTTLGQPFSDPIFGISGPAIAVAKGNKELLGAVNQALAKAKSSGYITELKTKYKMN